MYRYPVDYSFMLEQALTHMILPKNPQLSTRIMHGGVLKTQSMSESFTQEHAAASS